MRNNAIEFEKYIEEHRLPLNKGLNVDEFTIFSFPEKITINGVTKPVLGGGQDRRAVISLRDDDTLADIFCFNIASISKAQDKYKLYTTTFLISASLRVCAPRSWLPTFLQFYQCNSLGAGFCPVSLQVPITLHGVS